MIKGALLDPFKGTLGVSWFGLARAVLRLWGFMGLEFIVNSRKLEHRFRMIHAGIPFTLGHEANDVPTF